MALESTLEIPGLVTPLLTGSITGADLSEVGGISPANIIRTDQSSQVVVNWNLKGSLLGSPFFNFEGKWRVHAMLESIGPGTEYDFAAAPLNVDTFTTPPGTTSRDYTVTVPIAAGAVDSGVYKLVIAITYESPAGTPGPIAGFMEVGMVQYYTV